MAQELLTESLQEAVLAVLAFDDKHGALVFPQVLPEHFSGIYGEVAAPVLEYRRKYGKPPGRAHLEQLFSRAKLDPSDRKTHLLRRTLVNLAAQAEGINGEYIVNQTQHFVRSQRLKTALLEANERYLQGGDEAVADVEGILNNALRFRQQTLDAGSFLTDYAKAGVFQDNAEDFIPLGIPELDRYGIGLIPKRQMLLIQPKNSGKSWGCVHAGRQSVLQGKKVVHITLEMPESEVLDRYYQSFFGLATRDEKFVQTVLEADELGRITGFKTRRVRPRMDFNNPDIRKYLRKKIKAWGSKLDRLVVKEFPSGSLTMNQLRGYLDYLEITRKFIPNVLIIDYPDLFAVPTRDFRLALGKIFVELRGLASERNLALFTPTQSGRQSIGAKRVRSTDASEDISKVFTADTVLTYSQTEGEYQRGLARLMVEHARKAPRGTQVLLTQSYSTGQYVLSSALLPYNYWDLAGTEPEAPVEYSDEED